MSKSIVKSKPQKNSITVEVAREEVETGSILVARWRDMESKAIAIEDALGGLGCSLEQRFIALVEVSDHLDVSGRDLLRELGGIFAPEKIVDPSE